MTEQEFEEAVGDALDGLPEAAVAALDNLVILVEDEPPDGGEPLLGLYEGTPLTERSVSWVNPLPDRITIFRNPILRICHTHAQVRHQVRVTVLHEVGHYFGLSERRLHELGWA
jgi:predicted Zn-dependent protease with MMP-like domain